MIISKKISEVRQEITSLLQYTNPEDVVKITKHGEPVMALMHWKLFQEFMKLSEIREQDKIKEFLVALRSLNAPD